MQKNTIIIDLDGTLADITARRKLAYKKNGKINWDIFFASANIKLDLPNEPVIKLAQLFFHDNYKIIIFSGRSEGTQAATVDWLQQHNVPYHKLVMRPNTIPNWIDNMDKINNEYIDARYMPDEILKQYMLQQHVALKDVFLVIDDRDKVVNMWRSIGLNTFQVAPGDF